MRCRATVRTGADLSQPHPVTRVVQLRAQSPLVPRVTGTAGFEPYVHGDPRAARVALSAGAAGPVGGDHYELDVVVGSRSTLLLREVSATVVLPGPHGERSRTYVRVRVEEGGTLIWTPQPVVAAHGCLHEQHVDIDLAANARLFHREELVLGRHGEDAGSMRTHLRVQVSGRPVLVQELQVGPGAHGYTSAAVVGRHGALGTVVIVEPEGHGIEPGRTDGHTAIMPIDSTALQISAVGTDGLALRRHLDTALARCGPRWGTVEAARWTAVPR